MMVFPGSSGHNGNVDAELPQYRPVVILALATAFSLMLALAAWGMLARLDAAIVLHGVLHAESERKSVEHLEGGLLKELLVASGETVVAGQEVAQLDTKQTDEQIRQLRLEQDHLQFDLWRLEAEETGQPLDLDHAPLSEDRALHIIEAKQLFVARVSAHEAQLAALTRQIRQLEGDIAAYEGQRTASIAQLKSWTEERQLVASLVDRGATARQRLWEFDRRIASLQGDTDEYAGQMRAATEEIAKARAEIDALTQTRLADIAQTKADAKVRLATVDSQISALEDVRDRLTLRAPQSGRVIVINTVTPGAVLGSGQPLMEILPNDDRLIAIVKLPPDAIDSVHPGMTAETRLIAYKRSDAPQLASEVSYVSADLLEDPQTGEPYFESRISLDPDDLAKHGMFAVTAGMPVEVTMTIGERRAGDYVLEPILSHYRRAFREE